MCQFIQNCESEILAATHDIILIDFFLGYRKFFIPISGFRARDPLLENILSASTPKLTTYSLHVLGDTDVVVVAERSQTLIESCDEKYTRVERHEGGKSFTKIK